MATSKAETPTEKPGGATRDIPNDIEFPDGITEKQVGDTCELLSRLCKHKEFFQSKHCRGLRKALQPWIKEMHQKMYKGGSKQVYDKKKNIKRMNKAIRKRMKQLDKKCINSSALRKGRNAALKKLLAQPGSEALPMIPDGAVAVSCISGSSLPSNIVDQKLLEEKPQLVLETRADLKESQSGPADDPKFDFLKSRQPGKLFYPRSCYICKARYTSLHEFYDQLCPDCAKLNWTKRFQTEDMKNKVSLVTGGRVKIGYHVALKLLRAGCHTIVTTRFPHDAALRYSKEKDYKEWCDRLDIYGMDFRNIAGVEKFCSFIQSQYKRLDVLINNACQTIRRPTAYYRPLIHNELKHMDQLPAAVKPVLSKQGVLIDSIQSAQTPQLENKTKSSSIDTGRNATILAKKSSVVNTGLGRDAARMSQTPMTKEDIGSEDSKLPSGVVDVNEQQVDLRSTNSWLQKIEDVSTTEIAEVFAVNALAPFVINSKLIPMMKKTDTTSRKFIVNVSAMEGKFYRHKLPTHPHTNMAKAALNMMTRTCSADLAKQKVLMNAVDTGWINDENPLEKASAYAKSSNFQTPIDEIDAAARILDPVFSGLPPSSEPKYGQFFKDYHPTEW